MVKNRSQYPFDKCTQINYCQRKIGELYYRFSGAKRTTLAGFLSTSPSFSHEFGLLFGRVWEILPFSRRLRTFARQLWKAPRRLVAKQGNRQHSKDFKC
ncbi:hypothetical protein CEXT_355931 [Caerostris extrusa]|uniref:Uncharacterized protein n=1 Tax=Caerostris extrusa TaxID=172846 RepID=A0AAV4R1X5_CAEEX|nr:hypothetical protein CEXT_355931 [Caerostris extrusa]